MSIKKYYIHHYHLQRFTAMAPHHPFSFLCAGLIERFVLSSSPHYDCVPLRSVINFSFRNDFHHRRLCVNFKRISCKIFEMVKIMNRNGTHSEQQTNKILFIDSLSIFFSIGLVVVCGSGKFRIQFSVKQNFINIIQDFIHREVVEEVYWRLFYLML